MAQHNHTGEEGENEARIYLQKKGYKILHTNWHYGSYELDIIAEKDGELIIAEVKTRTSNHYEAPEDAVGKSKIKRIVSAADGYIRLNDIDLSPRFDIISICKTPKGWEIDHIEDAFYPPIM
ncbi:MAG: YraN family protein [Candidatus Azobacteroides sp.]|nr:YraN family protein [Candidatus Azobacteroides sp.]